MSTLKSLNPAQNPVLVKELRSRMRGARAFILLTVALLGFSGISYLVYLGVTAVARWSQAVLAPEIGQSLFITLAYLGMATICLITPAITAGAISSEYENQTYEMLIATPLPPARILWGKLLSALSYIFLLILAAIPLASVVFIYGGVAPREMLKTLLVLIVTATMLGTIGIFNSAWLKRSGLATVLTYLIVLGMTGLPFFVYILLAILHNGVPPRWPLVINPFSALASATISPASLSTANSSLSGGLNALLSGNIDVMTRPDAIPRPLYHYTLPLYGGITLVLYALASRLIRPTHRWRISRREGLTFALWGLLLLGVTAAAFGLSANRYEGAGIFIAPTPISWDEPVIVEESVVAEPIWGTEIALTFTDQAEIYAAVITEISADHPAGTRYILTTTDDSVGDPNIRQKPSVPLNEDLQTEIQALLGDAVPLQWVADRSEVPGLETEGGAVIDGVLLTLGNIQIQEDGSVWVSASAYAGPSSVSGWTYTLVKGINGWDVTEGTGVEWNN